MLYYQTLLSSQIRHCYPYFLLATLRVLYFGSMSFGQNCWWIVNRLFLRAVSAHRNTVTMTPILTGQNHASVTPHISDSAAAVLSFPGPDEGPFWTDENFSDNDMETWTVATKMSVLSNSIIFSWCVKEQSL